MIEDLISEMVRLATAGGAGLGVTLLVLLLGAGLVLVWRKVQTLPRDPPPPEDPPAEWNTDPDRGAVVVPGPPGGTTDEVQSG